MDIGEVLDTTVLELGAEGAFKGLVNSGNVLGVDVRLLSQDRDSMGLDQESTTYRYGVTTSVHSVRIGQGKLLL